MGADASSRAKFWKSFFEASANTKLSDPYTGDESFTSEHPMHAHGQGEQSLSFDHEGDASNASGSDGGTPRAAQKTSEQHKWSDDVSPFQALRSEMSSLADASDSSVTQAVHRLRLGDLPPDSPDLPLPTFESHLESYTQSPIGPDPSKGKSRAYTGSPAPRTLKAGADKHHPDLLQKLLRKNLSSPLPPPSPRQTFPSDLPKNWDGLADLSITPLSAFASPTKSSPVPPPPMSFALPRLPYSLTPSKEAARRMAQDVYQSTDGLDSPMLDPPSAMKDWATRGYDDLRLSDNTVAPSPSEAGRRGFEEEEYGEEESFELPGPPAGLDYGGGTTARIDELLNEDSFARLVDDDEGGLLGDGLEEEEEGGSFVEEGSYVEEGLSNDAIHRLEGPEDTLFGMPQKNNASFAGGGGLDDSFEEELGGRGGESGFRMMGPNDMDTLHGGMLLESEPFEVSPFPSLFSSGFRRVIADGGCLGFSVGWEGEEGLLESVGCCWM
jgi:DASH complex subunit ASK1